MKTQVAIIGAGPAGALLSLLLHRAGIDTVVLERQSREHVLGRIRAGMLEGESVSTLKAAGVGAGIAREGRPHETINIAWGGENLLSINTAELAGYPLTAYGQNSIQRDLYEAADSAGLTMRFEVSDVVLDDLDSRQPRVSFSQGGVREELQARFVIGCDGFHGVSRAAIPDDVRTEFERTYPFGWLGILVEAPPLPIIMYAQHERGFALCSMRGSQLSRYYVQCPAEDTVEDWPDDRFWSEFLARLPREQRSKIATGPSIEKSIAPLRSFVSEPMRFGSLLLAGDAAHIVPPTGAKGLNLAIADVRDAADSLASFFGGDDRLLESYSDRALARAWSAVRFSWSLTNLLHNFPGQSPFDLKVRENELQHLSRSNSAQRAFAMQYVGLNDEK